MVAFREGAARDFVEDRQVFPSTHQKKKGLTCPRGALARLLCGYSVDFVSHFRAGKKEARGWALQRNDGAKVCISFPLARTPPGGVNLKLKSVFRCVFVGSEEKFCGVGRKFAFYVFHSKQAPSTGGFCTNLRPTFCFSTIVAIGDAGGSE